MQFRYFTTKLRLLLVLFVAMAMASLAAANDESAGPRQWICSTTDLCIADDVANVGDVKRFESQNDCRLSCGKYGAIWPMPVGECSIGNERVYFNPWNVRFNVVAPNADTTQFLRETNRIFVSNILKECTSNCTLPLSKKILVKATVNSSSLQLDWNTNESYMLVVHTTDMATFVDIRASTVYGARHGFETLSNLVTGSLTNGLLMVSDARVYDRPMYPHRGILLDTSRNYIPLRLIRNTLNGMAASKLNVLHWHVVDTHSFPLEITRVPELQRFGAYSQTEVYTHADTQNLIKYARLRGIRVLIEIDGPSHAGNGWQWGPAAGLGNLAVCLNRTPWRTYCVQPPCGQLNPINDHMYAIMKEIYADVAEVGAPEETIHMGGDEMHIPCWNSTEEIKRRMIETGYDLSTKSFLKLWSQFHIRNLNSWDEVNQAQYAQQTEPKSVIVWSSHLTDPETIEEFLPKERFVIQTWVNSDQSLNRDLLQRGYRLILSTKDAWYLDHGFWGLTNYYNWERVYNNVMQTAKPGQVLGGEVCMWSEYVDQNSLEPRIWPRAGAAAERLWSNPKTSALLAQTRFYRYRERLIARGLHPNAVAPQWCVLNEGQCL